MGTRLFARSVRSPALSSRAAHRRAPPLARPAAFVTPLATPLTPLVTFLWPCFPVAAVAEGGLGKGLGEG